MSFLRKRTLHSFRTSSAGAAPQLAAAILALGTFASLAIFTTMDRHYRTEYAASESAAFARVVADIQSRFDLYAYGLRSLRNFAGVDTMPGLSRAHFDRFVNSRDFAVEFPGARGIGVIRYLKPDDVRHFLLEKRVLDNYLDFRIKQFVPHEGPRFVIQYVAPLESNAEAIGLDIASEPVRRHAAEDSIRRNNVTLTAPIQLVQASAKGATALLAMMPVFRSNASLATAEERAAAIEGWAYSPLLLEEVLADIVARHKSWNLRIEDEGVDGGPPLFDTFSNTANPVGHERSIDLYGRHWRIKGANAAASAVRWHESYVAAAATFLLFGLIGLLVFYRTRHLAKEQQLTVERSRLADIVEHASDAMMSVDIDGRIITWNMAARRLFKIGDGEMQDVNIRNLLSSEPDPIFAGVKSGQELPDGGLTLKTMCTRFDGSEFPALTSFFALRNDTRQLGVSVRDMSEQTAFEECILELTHKLQAEIKERTAQLDQSLALQAEIEHLAMHDPLTGLANRTLFRNKVMAAVDLHARDAEKGFALLALDLDRFKPVNDTYGHPIGDMLLSLIGERLRSCINPNETAARLGGDEFAILLEAGTGKERAVAIAMRVLTAMEQPFNVDGLRLEIGVSIGIALHDDQMRSIDADSVFKLADHALYKAKHNGRHGYHLCTDLQDAEGPHASRLAIEMREAIHNCEFHLQYQPIIDCATGQLDAFEALLRWRHPTRGPISPAEFIPVAEESDQIVALGEWALRTACAEAKGWDSDTSISVNVSPIQIKRAGWDDSVIAIVNETGIDPSRLIIEVTESVLMTDSALVLDRLQRLQDYGISIALDDFGTGYSSLSYLRRFRFNKLKIDKSFMRDSEDVVCAAIIRCIVRLGRQLSVQVISEGIETERQLRLVEREGCSHAQGYFISKPIDAPAARDYIRKNKAMALELALNEPDRILRKSA